MVHFNALWCDMSHDEWPVTVAYDWSEKYSEGWHKTILHLVDHPLVAKLLERNQLHGRQTHS
jgi:hypothetical protein